MKILVTGFSPFLKFPENSSEQVVTRLASEKWTPSGDCEVRYKVLPTDYRKATRKLLDLLNKYKPDALIQLGLAFGAKGFRLETQGRNAVGTETADASGYVPARKEIKRAAPPGLPSGLPVKAIYDELVRKGYPASISDSAGTYICNYTYYKVLEAIDRKQLATKAGFIHIPLTDDQLTRLKQGQDPSQYQTAVSMPEADLVNGLKTIIAKVVRELQKTHKPSASV